MDALDALAVALVKLAKKQLREEAASRPQPKKPRPAKTKPKRKRELTTDLSDLASAIKEKLDGK